MIMPNIPGGKQKVPTKPELQARIEALKAHPCMNSDWLGKLVLAELYIESSYLMTALKEISFVEIVMKRFEKLRLKENGGNSEEIT